MPNYTYYVGMSSYTDSFYHFGLPNTSELRKNAASIVGKIKNTIGSVQGKTEREWKKHKWVARKRGPGGKWIYDYGNGYPDEKRQKQTKREKKPKQQVTKLDTTEKMKAFEEARKKAFYRSVKNGKERSKFKDLDYDSDDYVVVSGQKVGKAEDGTAFVRGSNPYTVYAHGKTAEDAARAANEKKQKRSRGLKTKRGKQIY